MQVPFGSPLHQAGLFYRLGLCPEGRASLFLAPGRQYSPRCLPLLPVFPAQPMPCLQQDHGHPHALGALQASPGLLSLRPAAGRPYRSQCPLSCPWCSGKPLPCLQGDHRQPWAVGGHASLSGCGPAPLLLSLGSCPWGARSLPDHLAPLEVRAPLLEGGRGPPAGGSCSRQVPGGASSLSGKL